MKMWPVPLAKTNYLSLKGRPAGHGKRWPPGPGVAAACACTGFVIGVVTLTGLGLKLANAIPDHLGRQLCP